MNFFINTEDVISAEYFICGIVLLLIIMKLKDAIIITAISTDNKDIHSLWENQIDKTGCHIQLMSDELTPLIIKGEISGY